MNQAYYDIIDTSMYICYELCNPQAANRFINNISVHISVLQYFPRIGSIYQSNQERFLIFKSYLIFYEIHEKEKVVEILTVLHRKRSY